MADYHDAPEPPERVGTPSYPTPERPAPPTPERLNRNVLTIAAVLMGTLVLAAVVFMQPAKPVTEAPRVPAITVPRATFLEESPSAGSYPGALSNRAMAGAQRGVGAPADSLVVETPGTGDPIDLSAGVPVGGSLGNNAASSGLNGSAAPAPSPRAAAYAAALAAPVIASATRARDASDQAASQPGGEAPRTAGGAGEGWSPTPGLRGAELSAGASAGAEVGTPGATPVMAQRDDLTRQERWLMAAASGAAIVRPAVQLAPGPLTLQAGSIIPGVLLTAVNSDLPGDVVGQVARDVFDSQRLRTVLVPKGSRLIGKYDNQIGVGQDRLLVAWTRVIFPDGRSIALSGLPAKDRAGANGLRDAVNRHAGQVFGTATLLSLITAGAQLAQPHGGYGTQGYPSPGQIAAGATGQELSEVAAQLLRRNTDVQPTIRIRAGMPFNIFLNADLAFAGPYVVAP